MSTKEFFTNSDELKGLMSAARATIIAPFFANNVQHIKSVSEAFELAKNSPGTIELTGMPVYCPEKLGLPQGANQLLFNDGAVVGRCAVARKIAGEPNCDLKTLLPVIREAVYKTILSIEEMADAENPTQIKDDAKTPEELADFSEMSKAIKEAMKHIPQR